MIEIVEPTEEKRRNIFAPPDPSIAQGHSVFALEARVAAIEAKVADHHHVLQLQNAINKRDGDLHELTSKMMQQIKETLDQIERTLKEWNIS
jgi:predicted KAP-like P-loop ATPase